MIKYYGKYKGRNVCTGKFLIYTTTIMLEVKMEWMCPAVFLIYFHMCNIILISYDWNSIRTMQS